MGIAKTSFFCGNYGKNAKHSKRDLINAVFYIVKTGVQWHMMPSDFPNHKTVYSFYSRAKKAGIWEKMQQLLVEKSRKMNGKAAWPKVGKLDSQSVKTSAEAKDRGFDGGKKNQGAQKAHNCRFHG